MKLYHTKWIFLFLALLRTLRTCSKPCLLAGYKVCTSLNLTFSMLSILLATSSFPPSPGTSMKTFLHGFPGHVSLALSRISEELSTSEHSYPKRTAEDTTFPSYSPVPRSSDLILTSQTMSHSKVRKTSKYMDQYPNTILKQRWWENSQRFIYKHISAT